MAEEQPQDIDPGIREGLKELRAGRHNEAREAFAEATGRNPDLLDARFHLAVLDAREGGPGSHARDGAVDGLRQILAAAEKGTPFQNLDRACFILGSLLDDRPESREEAIVVYRRGLREDPLFAPGHNNLGALLMQKGQTLSALGEFKIALHLAPDYALPYRNLARLLFDQMSPAQMEQEYETLIDEFGTRSAPVLARLSVELINMGRAQVGESLYTRGHQIKNLMGLVGSHLRRYIRKLAPEDGELKGIAGEQERIFDQWVAYLRSMKQDTMNVALIDVQDLVLKVIDTVRPRAGSVTLQFATEASLPQVKADAAMLREAATNLVMNAVEAVPENGRVTVQTGHDPGGATVYIEVEDNGPGISRAEQIRVFDPGYSTKPKGNGYGLSICARIAAAHRGDLRVISRPGAGAVFRIDLPVDFEIGLEEESIGLQPVPLDGLHQPLTEEFIE